MKTLSKLMALIFTLTIIAGSATAQEKTTRSDKKAQKKETQQLAKTAKEEAARWLKQGYTNPIGNPTLEMQFEKAWSMINEKLENGHPRYITENGSATGETQAAAKMQAYQSAKLTIAEDISSQVADLIKNNFDNAGINTQEANSVTQTVSTSQTMISQELGRVITFVEAIKPVGKNMDYNVLLGYDFNEAKEIAKKVIQKKLLEGKQTPAESA